jgi:hypothetical protein
MTDWSIVATNALKAAENVIGAAWPAVASSASAQVAALVATAKYIEDNEAVMTQLEYETARLNQQRALEGVLSGYAAITIVMAQQAAEAAWNVVLAALKTATSLPFL